MNPNLWSLSKDSMHISIEGQTFQNLPGIIGRFGVQKDFYADGLFITKYKNWEMV
jgi:hypothetical protein